jgi:hypothetical protein
LFISISVFAPFTFPKFYTDEDKLSAYFRFSEGEDEDAEKREEFCDITKFENTAVVVGNTDSFILQESTSSVDEGENGKVKALYDLVFEKSGVGHASALAIPSPRTLSLYSIYLSLYECFFSFSLNFHLTVLIVAPSFLNFPSFGRRR